MAKVGSDGDGHGVSDEAQTSGRATYAFDVDGTPLRFIVLDTAHENGASEGVIRQTEVDRVIRPLLETARADHKWVVLASHHAASNLTDGTGLGGEREPDALSSDRWSKFLGQYDNVVFSMVAHAHRHRVITVRPPMGHAYWEIMTSAIADYPHQFRVVEIFDQDNGWLMLRGTAVDLSLSGDPVAADGKRAGVIDLTSGWLPEKSMQTSDKNVEVWIRKP
jgi:hypothetical protein